MSFNIGLSGLRAASSNLDVIGHNIANGNTIGMKAGRTQFSELYATSMGAVGGGSGGIGVEVATVSQLFTQGNITITGNDLDLAINGQGFFSVETPDQTIAYTRAGEFTLDKDGYMITSSGARLRGYLATNGQVPQSGQSAPIQFPTTAGIAAVPTTRIDTTLNLDGSLDRAPVQTLVTAQVNEDAPVYSPPLETYGTSLVTYDTQGNETPVSLYFVKTAVNNWQVWAEVPPAYDGGTSRYQAMGTLVFDQYGALDPVASDITNAATWSINVPNVAAGATDPAQPWDPVGTLRYPDLNIVMTPGSALGETGLGGVTQFSSSFSVSELEQDGNAPGAFAGISIGGDGIIQTRYSNGQTRISAQVALYNFRNLQGLQPQGGGYWRESPDSGVPIPGAPQTAGFGNLRQGALEESNVDITAELVNMITAQRSYQANAQTIKTQDQIFSTLVNLR